MLAHFAYSRPKSVVTPVKLTMISLALASALLGRQALAADTLPLGNLDARSTGSVSSGDTAAAGSLTTGMSFEAAEAAIPAGALNSGETATGDEKQALLRDANRVSIFLGTAVTDRFEVTLGLHGSYEHVAAGDRDMLFPASEDSLSGNGEPEGGWHGNVKQTAFSSASLFLKMKLLDWQGLRLAVAPFIESGAGEQATYALTRSVGPKAGFMAIASYGAAGVADVSLNLGYRYRDPEVLGDVALRHEQFGKVAVRAYATRNLSFFVAGEGRRLMIAEAQDLDIETGKRLYAPSESGEVKGGATVRFAEVDVSAFGGGRPKHAGSFGFGKTTYGLAVALPLGNYRGERPRPSFASEIEKQEDEKDAKAALVATPAKDAAVKPASDDYSEMIGDDIDPLQALGADDGADFKDVDSRTKQYEADAKVESDDAKVERELKELKAAEELASKERDRLDKIEATKARKQAIERSKEDAELMREWMDEAKKDADAVPGIDNDEMQWNGLE